MLCNPACCCLINGTVCIPPMKENYQPPEHLKDFISVSLKEVWNIMVHSTRCIHKVISVMEVLLGETLKCTPDLILCFWKQERYQNNGRPFEYEKDKYPNLYEGVLIDELCNNARWNISVQCAYRYFSYVLQIVGSILDQGLPQMAEKTILNYFIKDLVTYHKRHCYDLGHHDAFNGIDMNNIFVSNGIIKSAYEGHYDFPNLYNCKYTRPIIAADWVEKMPPSIHKLRTYLNTNKKWTFAVYNCVCSHKFIDFIKYVKNSELSYWIR